MKPSTANDMLIIAEQTLLKQFSVYEILNHKKEVYDQKTDIINLLGHITLIRHRLSNQMDIIEIDPNLERSIHDSHRQLFNLICGISER